MCIKCVSNWLLAWVSSFLNSLYYWHSELYLNTTYVAQSRFCGTGPSAYRINRFHKTNNMAYGSSESHRSFACISLIRDWSHQMCVNPMLTLLSVLCLFLIILINNEILTGPTLKCRLSCAEFLLLVWLLFWWDTKCAPTLL